jgi:hypothetical protein
MSHLQYFAGVLAVLAVAGPVSIFIRDLYKLAFPRSVVITDENGDVIFPGKNGQG